MLALGEIQSGGHLRKERTSGQENENTIRIETTDVTVVWSMYQSEVCVVVRRGEGGG